MSDRSKGKYWDRGINLVEGCTPVSAGCANCWSADMAKRFGRDFSRITLHMDRLERAVWRRKPTVYAIWNDLFHPDVPDEFISDVFVMLDTRVEAARHKFLILTKRPDRLCDYLGDWPHSAPRFPNIYFGTSCEDQETFDERVPHLLNVPTENRFLSLEPLLGPIDIDDYLYRAGRDPNRPDPFEPRRQVIVGCESGPNRRPCELEWVQSIVNQCREVNNDPCFVKQVNIDGKVIKDQNDPRFPEWAKNRSLVW